MLRIIHPNRWFIWTIALIVMIFIVVLGAIQRYAIEQEIEIAGQNSLLGRETSKLDTSGWKTYRNEQYGFEVKYPSEWFREDGFGSISFSNVEVLVSIGSNKEYLNSENFFKMNWHSDQRLNHNGLPIDQWFEDYLSDNDQVVKSKAPFTVDGHHGLQVELAEKDYVGSQRYIYLALGPHIFEITYRTNTSQQEEINLAILSTLNFFELKPIEYSSNTSGWKTYRDETRGFEFKYPSERGRYEVLGLNKIDGASIADCSIADCEDGFLTFYIWPYETLQGWYDLWLVPYKGKGREQCWSTLRKDRNMYECLDGSNHMRVYQIKEAVLVVNVRENQVVPFSFFETLTFFEPKR